MRWSLLSCALLAPVLLSAQQQRERSCDMELFNYDSTTTFAIKLPSKQYNSWYGRGVRGKCVNSDQRISGDSLEVMGDVKLYTLIGRGHYEENRITLDADRIYYFQLEERVLAEGNVVAVTQKGTVMRGPRAEYYRAAPGSRSESRLVATGRPVTRLSPSDAGGGATDTTTVVADRINDIADSLVYAGGAVVITRPDLVATSDSATMDSGKEWARLTGRPRIESTGESKYTLVGAQIDIWSRQRKLSRVLSADSAKATSDDVTLVSDTIDLRLADDKLSRAYAWGKSRARARATDRDIVADSIDVDMPGQLLRELRALRTAHAQSKTDSTKFISNEEDWLRGDTIVASFDSTRAAPDSASKPVIRKILATGTASSFYQVASADGPKAGPNLNYVKGRTIALDFGPDKAIKNVTVTEKASGLYLERETPDSLKADSTASKLSGKDAKPANSRAPSGKNLPTTDKTPTKSTTPAKKP